MPDPTHHQLAQAHPATDTLNRAQANHGQAHASQPTQEKGSSGAFDKLLGSLGDHRELEFGPWHVMDLPVIVVDHGLHVYSSVESMDEAGVYSFDHSTHHILNATTHEPVPLDMSVTSLVFFQWIAMIICAAVFIPMARRYRRNGNRPLRGLFNAMEAVVVYVRDEMIGSNIPDARMARRLAPIFLTFFFFILVMNLTGLVPGGHTATGSVNVTAGLAIVAFFVIQISAMMKIGLGNWVKHLSGGVHWLLWPIMVPVEILGLFTKPFALCVRLYANMTAGHVMLLSLIGLIFVSSVFLPVTVGFSLFISLLEILVAFIQAYIFTILTVVFTGMAMASHGDHDETHGVAPSEQAAAH